MNCSADRSVSEINVFLLGALSSSVYCHSSRNPDENGLLDPPCAPELGLLLLEGRGLWMQKIKSRGGAGDSSVVRVLALQARRHEFKSPGARHRPGAQQKG